MKIEFYGDKYLNFLSFINLPCGHVMSHKKFGPDRFSCFDVYWIQTNRQTSQIYTEIIMFNKLSVKVEYCKIVMTEGKFKTSLSLFAYH